MKVGDYVRYTSLTGDDRLNEEERNHVTNLRGIVLSKDEHEIKPHFRILWNTGEVLIHLAPPYEENHFEVTSTYG